VPAPVLAELDYMVSRAFGPSAFPTFIDQIRDGVLVIESLTDRDYERTAELMRTYVDLRVGFVDAAVLAIVERLRESKLATLDHRHFSVMRPRHVDALELLPA
jgi:predicted nucleic acid-binding protein